MNQTRTPEAKDTPLMPSTKTVSAIEPTLRPNYQTDQAARAGARRHIGTPAAAKLALDRRHLKKDESARLSLRRAAARLKKRWGISANAAGLSALLEGGRGPRALAPRLFGRGRGPEIPAQELDRWAEYQVMRSVPLPFAFDNPPTIGTSSVAPRILFVSVSDVTYDLSDEMKANGWQVLWAADCIDALSLVESGSVDAAAFLVDESNVEMAILLLEALREHGTPAIVMVSARVPGAESCFEGKCHFFDSFPAFEAAVNATVAGKKMPVRLKDPEDEAERGHTDIEWLKALASSDQGGGVNSGE